MDYLRLSVTDRCNLRCQYCMPEEGIDKKPHEAMLSWEEMHRLCRILVDKGLRKIRITGGEPFVRKDLTFFLKKLARLEPRPDIGITTNGVLLNPHLDELKAVGITRLNISMDSLTPELFHKITRRDEFWNVWKNMLLAVDKGFHVKINMVVQPGLNDHEITDFAKLTKTFPITVRFIEPMPFSGTNNREFEPFSGDDILNRIQSRYELTSDGKAESGVATRFKIPGHEGYLGIINGYSRTFCATCSRLRISAEGQMRTCLYGENVLDLRELLRCGSSDDIIAKAIDNVVQQRFKNGFEAQKSRKTVNFDSMSTIGG